jgi:hypothetical protein
MSSNGSIDLRVPEDLATEARGMTLDKAAHSCFPFGKGREEKETSGACFVRR